MAKFRFLNNIPFNVPPVSSGSVGPCVNTTSCAQIVIDGETIIGAGVQGDPLRVNPNIGSGGIYKEETFNVSSGQTLIVLSQIPTLPTSVELNINGQVFYYLSNAFTLSGNFLTFIGSFELAPTDNILVKYI